MKYLQWRRIPSLSLLLLLVIWIKPADHKQFGQTPLSPATTLLAQDPGHGGGGGG